MAIINWKSETAKKTTMAGISGDKSGACLIRDLETEIPCLFFFFFFFLHPPCFTLMILFAAIRNSARSASRIAVIHHPRCFIIQHRSTLDGVSLFLYYVRSVFPSSLVFFLAGTSDFPRFVRLHETFITRQRCFLQRYFDHFKL